ncbi:ABC-type nitrate/sulfonate/bicarbonate transport system substrate-binding protein [Paraburkholderia sp. JPY465]|uniref:hypothetical protein n=1 Tax=Paraburkholderia sp. JPY465 TaxID=3042285 RepID=UPI003D1D8147
MQPFNQCAPLFLVDMLFTMHKRQIHKLLVLAHEEAYAFVEENPARAFKESEELFDEMFFHPLSRHIGEMTIAEVSTRIREGE